jgi:alkane 1-monooxygenase
MSVHEPQLDSTRTEVRLSPLEVALIWSRHLASLLIPSLALVFLWTGPHPWYIAPAFLLPLGTLIYLDQQSSAERRQPNESLAASPFDGLVYVLAALQLLIVFELARMFTQQDIFSIDMVMMVVVVGGSSGFSIITAHELIHRRSFFERTLGRLLLCTVLYEHFYTEHLRGHHRLVATEDDPATAHFGETYPEFWRRTVPAQFRSAWQLETQRLGCQDAPLLNASLLQNRIVHGLVVGWGLAFAVFFAFGPASFVAYLLQAFFAVRLLEVVNYFEHWGLQRKSPRVRPQDSWDTYSRFTYYGLTGLSRHADHHAYPNRPYQQLRVWDEAPVLPTGYVGLIDRVFMDNDTFIENAVDELKRRELGPYAADATAAERERLDAYEARIQAGDARTETPGPRRLQRVLEFLPDKLRPAALIAAVLLVATLGVQFEAGRAGSGSSFAATLARHAMILAVFAGAVLAQQRIAKTIDRDGLAWIFVFAAMAAVGVGTDLLLR